MNYAMPMVLSKFKKKQISFSMVQKGRRGEDYAEFVHKQEWIDQEITV